MTKTKRSRKKRTLILLLAVMSGAAFASWHYFFDGGDLALMRSPWKKEGEKVLQPTPPSDSKIGPPQGISDVAPSNAPQAPVLPEGETVVEEVFPEDRDPCANLAVAMSTLFTSLEDQDYVRQFEIKEGLHNRLATIFTRLFATPPKVVGETDSLLTVITNAAHFFRVLGPRDSMLLREYLKKNDENIENHLSLFYRWMQQGNCPRQELNLALPLPNLYEYAVFFLNTMGGRSYLFRRSARARLLSTYYCLLVIDQANDEIINRYGLDIKPHLDSLLGEMAASHVLERRDDYLEILYAMKNKYEALHGQQRER